MAGDLPGPMPVDRERDTAEHDRMVGVGTGSQPHTLGTSKRTRTTLHSNKPRVSMAAVLRVRTCDPLTAISEVAFPGGHIPPGC